MFECGPLDATAQHVPGKPVAGTSWSSARGYTSSGVASSVVQRSFSQIIFPRLCRFPFIRSIESKFSQSVDARPFPHAKLHMQDFQLSDVEPLGTSLSQPQELV